MATAELVEVETEAEELLRRIQAKNRDVREAQGDYERKNELAKNAKKRWEALQEELNKLVEDSAKELPLFAGPGKSRAEPAPAGAPAEDESWRLVPIDALVEHGLSPALLTKLADAAITNIGAIADHTASGGRLVDLDGIGPASAEKIELALEGFWAARRPAQPPDAGDVKPEADWQSTPVEEILGPGHAHLAGLLVAEEIGTAGALADFLSNGDDLAELEVDDSGGLRTLSDEECGALREALLRFVEARGIAGDFPPRWIDPALEREGEAKGGEEAYTWRHRPLKFLPVRGWPAGTIGHYDQAVEALARPLDGAPPIQTLGQLVDQLTRDGGMDLEDLSLADVEGEPTCFSGDQARAVRFALLSYRENEGQAEGFAADVPAWWVDPTLLRLLFKVEFRKPRRGGEARPPAYLWANSKMAAVEYADAHWGKDVSGVWPVNADSPPEGARVEEVPRDSYEDRVAAHRVERAERLAEEAARKEAS
jgi:hypothetical protein